MGKFIDLTGQTFGRWTVLGRDEEHSTKKTIKWKCKCSCENHTIGYIDGYSLKSGNSTSCGCSRLEDLTGQIFGKWKVIKLDQNNKKYTYWLCECQCEKHTIKSIRASELKNGNSKSCGCIREMPDLTGQTFNYWKVLRRSDNENRKDEWVCECQCKNHTIQVITGHSLRNGLSKSCKISTHEDMTGLKFGHLTVLRFDEESYKKGRKQNKSINKWICECDCESHNIVSVARNCLIKGSTISCGCSRIKDLVGQKFGKLLVVKFSHIGDKGNAYWECICECGNIALVNSDSLVQGSTKSCGCLISAMERDAKDYFIKINENFITQHVYKDCVYKNKLKFDFYFPKYNCCLEFDGQQHFEPVRFNGKSLKQAEKDFKKQKVKDKIKDDYCKTNNIGLIRIPYWEFNNYKKILLNELGIGGEKCL